MVVRLKVNADRMQTTFLAHVVERERAALSVVGVAEIFRHSSPHMYVLAAFVVTRAVCSV